MVCSQCRIKTRLAGNIGLSQTLMFEKSHTLLKGLHTRKTWYPSSRSKSISNCIWPRNWSRFFIRWFSPSTLIQILEQKHIFYLRTLQVTTLQSDHNSVGFGQPLIIWVGCGVDFSKWFFLCWPSKQIIIFFVMHHAPQMINSRPLRLIMILLVVLFILSLKWIWMSLVSLSALAILL